MDSTPPLRLYVDPQAAPKAVMSPCTIPIHWADDVKAGLDRDVRLGVIEKVPVNVPVQWCSRMLITPKSNGNPRRVIDFTPVNKHAPRQLHHTKSPYTIATGVPANKVKTVLDNWHGYHSVPIHPDDRHLTTFITPYGRYQYKTAPQGFISAGDGYTQRMDHIVEGTQNFDHCVDDSILWDSDIETNFYSVCKFLQKCANAGCVFNPDKFQFAQEEVNFLGFKISMQGLGPTDAFIDTINSFPTPQNLTDVRAWFGTINQVSYAFASTQQMEPFRKLLSSKLPFVWSQELDQAFISSKAEIIKQCTAGVRKFEPSRKTVLATDWSRSAVGCWLAQKFCSCKSDIPGCCNEGWQTVHVSSKFNSPPVSRYHPVEGEAYAAAWALEKCKIFVLGHPDLTLAVDHKPLLAILGNNQDLTDVINPRLMNFKLKSLAYRFLPVHIPGKKHIVPDTLSRRSDSPVNLLPKVPKTPPISNNVLPEYADEFGPPSWISQPKVAACEIMNNTEDIYYGYAHATIAALASSAPTAGHASITWEKLRQECLQCPEYSALRDAVLAQDRGTLNRAKLSEYERVFPELTVLDEVVMLQNRIVIPKSLRQAVLSYLHIAHAGTQTMLARAVSTLYWPGFKADIAQTRDNCHSCMVNAPSNPTPAPQPDPDLPSYPFQVVCLDFFDYQGYSYLILVDKYSNWLSILKLQQNTSKNLIIALREYFTVFGIAETVCSDGAAVFTANEVSQFFETWGIRHRISSAYYAESNKRAELGVKAAKRLIRNNIGVKGSLQTNQFAQALLSQRNAPDPHTKVSPAEIVFGHKIRDTIPQPSYAPLKHWADLARDRETCFLKRHYLKSERLQPKKFLSQLVQGDHVYIQDQAGTTPKKWNKSGTVLESLPHESFLVKIDGSGHVTKRNRRFLRKFTPFQEQPIRKPNPPGPLPPSCCSIMQNQEPTYPTTLLDALDTPLLVAATLADRNHRQSPTY